MSSTPTPTPQEENLAHYKHVLRGLVDMANDMAQATHKQHLAQAQTTPQPTQEPPQDLTIPFDRLARSIRRTVLLAEHLERAPTQTHAAQNHRIAARKRILREVEDVIQRNAKSNDVNALNLELRDRLDAPNLEDDIDTRPLDDIIDDITRDLRVANRYTRNWKRRTPEQVKTLCQRAATLPKTWTTPPRPSPQPQPPRRLRQPPPPSLTPRPPSKPNTPASSKTLAYP